jgi:hypothetical protein
MPPGIFKINKNRGQKKLKKTTTKVVSRRRLLSFREKLTRYMQNNIGNIVVYWILAILFFTTVATLYVVNQNTRDTAKAAGSQIQFSRTSLVFPESNTTPTILVELNTPDTQTVTANYAVTGGTATSGTDYTLANGTVSIPVGETAKSIPLSIIDDSIVEENETITISLSNPSSGNSLGANVNFNYTIIDNEQETNLIGNDPTDLNVTSGLRVRLDASNVTTSGSNVTSWNDQSGNNNNANQPTTGQQPIVVNNAINGKPVVRFDGSNDWLKIDETLLNDTTSQGSVFVISRANLSSISTQATISTRPNSGSNGFTYRYNSDGTLLENWYFHTGSSPVIKNPISNNQYNLQSFLRNGNSIRSGVGGNYQPATTISNFTPSGIGVGTYIGSENEGTESRLNGDIAEILVYDRELSQTELSQVNCYLAGKYAVTVNGCKASLQLHLDAEIGTGQTTNGAAISAWTDQSGRGNNAAQAAATNRPTFRPNVINGKPVVRFDGVNDRIATGAINLSNSASSSLYSVVKASGTGEQVAIEFSNDYNGAGVRDAFLGLWLDRTTTGTRKSQSALFGPAGYSSSSANDNLGVFSITASTFDKALNTNEVSYYINGVQSTTRLDNSNNLNNFGNHPFYIGGRSTGTFPANADFGEVILFEGGQGEAGRNIIQNYLSTKFGIAVSPDLYSLDVNAGHKTTGIGASSDSKVINSGISGGLSVSENSSSLAAGEYVLIGSRNLPNTVATADLPSGITSRWNNSWGLDKTSSDGVSATLSFDFSQAQGGTPGSPGNYKLLYRAGTTGQFLEVSAPAPSIVGDKVRFSLTDTSLIDGYYTLGTTNNNTSPLGLLDAPTGLNVNKQTNETTADLSWIAPTNGTITNYTIEYSNDGFVNNFASVIATGTSISIPNLTQGPSYSFRVLANGAVVNSNYSSVSSITFAPRITGITPNSGPTIGGENATITGTNFNISFIGINVNNPGANITNYEGVVTFDSASLIASGKMRSDCGDIRVLNQTNNEILYWLDSGCNTDKTVVWYRVPTLNTGNNSLKLTFNNPGLTSASNLASFSFGNILSFSNNNKLWVKAGAGTGTSANGSVISQWQDQSGNNNHLNVQNGFSGATLQTSGIGNKPALQFNGSNSYQFTSEVNIRTFYLVWNETNPGLGTANFLGRTTSSPFSRSGDVYFDPASSSALRNGTFSINKVPTVTTANAAVYNTPALFSLNTTALLPTNTFDRNGTTPGPFIGYLSEIILFSTSHTGTTRDNIESYLDKKYNLSSSNIVQTITSPTSGVKVAIGSNNATVQSFSSTSINITIPSGNTGPQNVIVTNPDNQSDTLTNGYTYNAPTVTGISPNSGPSTGGTFVTVTGTGFSNNTLSNPNSERIRYIELNNNSGSTIVNYEDSVVLDTKSLIAAGKMRADCGDIRVKDVDGTTDLNYYIDGGCNTENTIVWFKVPNLAIDYTVLTLKYGNLVNTSQSNISNFSFGSLLSNSISNPKKLWLSGNVTDATGDNTQVSNWIDRTGFGNHFGTSTAPATKPTLQTGKLNGKPIIQVNSGQRIFNTAFNPGSNFSVFSVARYNGGTQGRLIASAFNNWAFGYEGGFEDRFFFNGWVNQPNSPADTIWDQYTGIGNGSISSVYENGNLLASNNGGLAGPSGICIGASGTSCGSQISDGQVAELLVFDTALGSSDQATIQNYLNRKYRLYNTSGLPEVSLGNEQNFEIRVGNQPLYDVIFVNSSTITGYTRAGLGLANVSFANNDGTFVSLNNAYTYGVAGSPNPVIEISHSNNGQNETSTLSWVAPNDNGNAITDYIIEYSTDSNFTNPIILNDGVNNSTSYVVTGLNVGQSYYFRLKAVNGIGESNYSAVFNIPGYACDNNLAGGNLTTTNNQVLSGTYCNINIFTVPSSTTATVATGNILRILANSANILGTLSANNSGFAGTEVNGNGPGGGIRNGAANYSAGGGYGGAGGNGSSSSIGGSTYGSQTSPIDLGSGGAGNTNGYIGGDGGGSIKLVISGNLVIDGILSSNGENGVDQFSSRTGGGSGGSIWIDTGSLSGCGSISARGGNAVGGTPGVSTAGNGGGGRIAIYADSDTRCNTFSTSAAGGTYGSPGGTGTVYDASQPEAGLISAEFDSIPNPVNVGNTFNLKIKNIRNTTGGLLTNQTCSVTVTGQGGYSQTITGGSVTGGVCNLPSSFSAPTLVGSYTASITATGGGASETNSNIPFTVYLAPSNLAKANGVSAEPIYNTLLMSPVTQIIGNNVSVSATGLIDSGNDGPLNNIPCTFTITGPNSYSASFNSGNVVNGNCSYNFSQFQLPSVSGSYSVTLSVQGPSGVLTTPATSFNRNFDINLGLGIIPGANTYSPDPIVFSAGINPTFTSPVVKRFDTVTNIPTGTACKTILYYDNIQYSQYTSTVNSNGQCTNTVPRSSLVFGNLTVRTEVTLVVNSINYSFLTNSTPVVLSGFPSNKATENSGDPGKPVYTSINSTPTIKYINQNVGLSITGLTDSANGGALNNQNCTFTITGPNSYNFAKSGAVTAGVCSVTIIGTTELPLDTGNYNFTVSVQGPNSTLVTNSTSFTREHNIYTSGGLIPGAHTADQNPVIVNQNSIIRSPNIYQANNSTLVTNGRACKLVYRIDSGAAQEISSTTSGGRCSFTIPAANLPSTGTLYTKTIISLFNSDYNSSYTFETGETTFQIKNTPTGQICANPTFRDDNNNGIYDGSDILFAGVTTRLYNSLNSLVGTISTTNTGPNCFTNLFDDIYRLEQSTPSGGVNTLPGGGAVPSYTNINLGVGGTEDRSFGYFGSGNICPNPTFIDVNEDGVYNGADYLISGRLVNLYQSSNLATPIASLTTNGTAGSPCFNIITPGSYVLEQEIPANSASTTGGTVSGSNIRQSITHNFGSNTDRSFGFKIFASNKAKENSSALGTPVHNTVNLNTQINPTYNEKAFVDYPVSSKVTGLVDSSTNLALNGIGICDITFSGPSFNAPITVTNQDVVGGVCEVNNTLGNNSSVIPNIAGTGNIVSFVIDGDSGTLTTPNHLFDVQNPVSTICFDTFADYNNNGNQDPNEPQLSGVSTELIQQPSGTVIQTINSTNATQNCFVPVNISPAISYNINQISPIGANLTGGNTANQPANAFPNDGSVINTITKKYPYRGNSSITPSVFRDDNQNGVNNSEASLNTGFTGTLRDFYGNIITSNLPINGTNNFDFLLSSNVNGGNYSITVNKGSLNATSSTVNPKTINVVHSNNTNEEFGFYSATTICPNPTYFDSNNNTIKETSEPLINSLSTSLIRISDNQVLQTILTNGSNCFTNVVPDNYKVSQNATPGGILTTANTQTGNIGVGTQPGGAGTTVSFNANAQFGINENINIGYRGGGQVCPYPTYQDRNNNGVQDLPADQNISGLSTQLKNSSGDLLATISTDNTTCFTGLLDGSYRVTQTPPANTTSSTGGNEKIVIVTGGNTQNVQFGHNGSPKICPVAFRDDNSNGIKDGTEVDLIGSSLVLRDSGNVVLETIISSSGEDCFATTLSIGSNYSIEGLALNNYTITNAVNPISINNIGFAVVERPTFGYNGNSTICTVHSFIDSNSNAAYNSGESHIAGLNTRLRLAGSNSDLQVVQTPGESGGANQICFSPVPPGQYTVIQDTPAGSYSTTGGNQNFSLGAGETKNIVFGYAGNGSICNDIFNDEDFDGVFDSNETRLIGYEVKLYLQSNLTTPYAVLTSSTSGSTCFNGLFPEDYRVIIENIQPGFASTTGGNSKNVSITASNGFVNNIFGYTNNSNYVLGAIRGFVYVDRDKDGNYEQYGQDTTEVTVFDNDVSITDQEVRLYREVSGSFTYVSSLLTDNQGKYSFVGLTPGTYRVVLPTPLGTKAVFPALVGSPILAGAQESGNLVVLSDEKFINTDFSVQYTARICLNHFVDKNNDGVFDADGDDNNPATTSDNDVDLLGAGLPGIYYQLEYNSFNGIQVTGGGSSSGYLINNTNKCIEEIPPRDYTVKFRKDLVNQNTPINYTSIFDTRIYDQATPNQTTTVFLGSQSNINARTFTNFVINNTVSSLSGRVWNRRPSYPSIEPNSYLAFDTDGDDNQTGTSATNDYDYDNDYGYGGQIVYLQKCQPGFGEDTNDVNIYNSNPQTTITDSLGQYSFTNITPGSYSVIRQFSLPFEASVRIRENSCNGSSLSGYNYIGSGFAANKVFWNNYPNSFYGNSGATPGTNFNDYGIEARNTGFVNVGLFIDQNKNGQFDSWETNRPQGHPDGFLRATFTQSGNSDGLVDDSSPIDQVSYNFTGIPPASYDFRLVNPINNYGYPGITPTEFNKQNIIVNNTFGHNQSLKFGFEPTNSSTITGKTFIDRDGDGNYEADGEDANPGTTFDNDIIVPGASVEIYFGPGSVSTPSSPSDSRYITTLTSNSNGDFSLGGLAEGYYYAVMTTPAPAGTVCQRCKTGFNNDVAPVGNTQVGPLIYVGRNSTAIYNTTYNYNAKLELSAFYDVNGDFIKNTTELLGNNVGFRLISSDGYILNNPNRLSEFFSSEIIFSSLPPGNYTVELLDLINGVNITNYNNPDNTINLLESEEYSRNYSLSPLTNNSFTGKLFIDKTGINNIYEPAGEDNNSSLTFDNEAVLAGATVYLSGPGGLYTTTTNANGDYTFNNLPTGKYSFHRYDSADTFNTNPIPNVIWNNADFSNLEPQCMTYYGCKSYIGSNFESKSKWSWNTGSIQNISNQAFLEDADSLVNNIIYVYTGSIRARCIDDRNGDGSITYYPDINYTESPINGCSFNILTPTGEILNFASNQSIRRNHLQPGNYVIQKLNNVSGRVNTNTQRFEPSIANFGNVDNVNINLPTGISYIYGFFNYFQFDTPVTNNSSIIGKAFFDRNSDGFVDLDGADNDINTIEDNDKLLQGINLTLSGTASRITTTNNEGKYQFTDLALGGYSIVSSLIQGNVLRVVDINQIQLVNSGANYEVFFKTKGFIPGSTGHRVHFYWDSEPANIGDKIHISPNPYLISVSAKPPGATRLCAVVADSTNTVVNYTGDCHALP